MPRQKGAPPQVTVKSLDDYLEAMTKSAFQSGISWDVIHAKWDGFREVFKNFDVKHVANLTPRDVDKLLKDTRIVRNRGKVEATVHNAQTLIDIDKEFGAFRKYLRSFKGDYEALVKNMKKRFKFLGDSGSYIFLWIQKEKVPDYHEWREAHPRCAARRPCDEAALALRWFHHGDRKADVLAPDRRDAPALHRRLRVADGSAGFTYRLTVASRSGELKATPVNAAVCPPRLFQKARGLMKHSPTRKNAISGLIRPPGKASPRRRAEDGRQRRDSFVQIGTSVDDVIGSGRSCSSGSRHGRTISSSRCDPEVAIGSNLVEAPARLGSDAARHQAHIESGVVYDERKCAQASALPGIESSVRIGTGLL